MTKISKDQIPDNVVIFDTTLRDGEQSPGASMTLEQKIEVAALLDDMGVDIIEAGFPIASDGDFEAVSEIAKNSKDSIICGLSRASFNDIDRAGAAIKHAKRGRIHTFIATSPLHMEYKLNMTPDTVLEKIAASVARAKTHTDDVEWSAEDATRTEHDFLCRAVEVAIKAGATTINLPDTVGYSMPDEYRAMFEMVINRVPNADKVVFSTHCHNDLGFAVANSIAGIQGGARQIECTINGLGERAGNAALEEIVMGMRTRGDILPYDTRIESKMLVRASNLVSAVAAFPVQYNKAIVGKNAFAHESGIHQDGMLKNAETYEIMTPESVGVNATSLTMGKHSGRHAFKDKLSDLGYELGDNAFLDAFTRFKQLADKKKNIYDEDIIALIESEISEANESIRLVSLEVAVSTDRASEAILVLEIDGKQENHTATGDGGVDATYNAIKALTTDSQNLLRYQVQAVTEGTDAQAHVSVRLEEDGKQVIGQGVDTDTIVASAKAYISALNKLVLKRKRNAPDAI